MRSQIKLGRLLGVDIGLHYSWFVIAFLITTPLAARFILLNPAWGRLTAWAAAAVAAALFFVSLVVHELSHAVVARSRGVPVRSITLFALGGVTRTDKDAGDARTEFWMGIVGPITSAAIGAACLGFAWLLGWRAEGDPVGPATAVLMWLGYINLVLAAFNLIPGFPLDGGRMLRAAVWWKTGNQVRATRIAAGAGQVVACAFIVIGLLQFVSGAGIGGLWLAFIGWFLLEASRSAYVQVAAEQALTGLRAGDLMSRDVWIVHAGLSLRRFVDDFLTRTGQRVFFVSDHGRMKGLITPNDVKSVAAERWTETPVESVMRPLARVHALTSEASVATALEVMARENVNELPVVDAGEVRGVVSRGGILQALRTRTELAM